MTKQLRVTNNPDRMKKKSAQSSKPARKQQATKQEKRAERRPKRDDAPTRTSPPRSTRPIGARSSSKAKPTQDAVAGRNPVVEALRAGVPALVLIIASRAEMDERMMEAIRLAKNANLAIKEVARGVLDIITGTTNHQGIGLVIKEYQYTNFDDLLNKSKNPALIIGMDGVTDPHNLGAIVRSASAFGADGVVIPERRNASMTGSAWKSSAGAAARMPISQVTNLVRSIEDAKKAGLFVVGLDADGQESLPNFSLAKDSVYVIVGSEGKGLSRLVREKCDLILSIPMSSEMESLNASVATAIVMHWIASERESEK
jgi:23S rRNA (guanosine2251-2'-O)-methyltransferase